MQKLTIAIALISLLTSAALASEALEPAPASEQKAPVELVQPKISPRQAFREGLDSLRENLHRDLGELREVSKSAQTPEQRLAADQVSQERKQRYELDLLRLQLTLAQAEGQAEKSSQLQNTLERLEALYSQRGEDKQ